VRLSAADAAHSENDWFGAEGDGGDRQPRRRLVQYGARGRRAQLRAGVRLPV